MRTLAKYLIAFGIVLVILPEIRSGADLERVAARMNALRDVLQRVLDELKSRP